MSRMWYVGFIIWLLVWMLICGEVTSSVRIKRQFYGNGNVGFNGYGNAGYNNVANNPALLDYYHRIWDQMHDPALGGPPVDPFAPPPPDPAFDEWAHRMGWVVDPPPPDDPALNDWAHRMGWAVDPPPPADPAMDEYLRRLAWENIAFDPTIESELFHGFGFIPVGWAYEHYLPPAYMYSQNIG